jgi:uncharacterized protein (TIGR02996 family)
MATLTMPEAFLQDVIEHRDDDMPRLVCADWLEERGEGVRAEFIRVQCELADWRKVLERFTGDHGDRRLAYLRRRERGLLGENVSTVPGTVWPRYCRWCEEAGINPAWVYVPGFGIPADDLAGNHFRRGFVAEITCRLADWCGGRCPAEGCVHGTVTSERGEGFKCPACRGTGRIPGHGPALVRAAPLERVTLSDREPTEFGVMSLTGAPPRPFWRWTCCPEDALGAGPDRLHRAVFTRVPGGALVSLGGGLDNARHFDTRQSALDNVSAALLAWAEAQPTS